MKSETFEAAQELQDRILQLQTLKKYMESFLACKPFQVEIKTSVLGYETMQPIPFINGRHENYKHYLTDSSDGQFILQQLQFRIAELQNQFDNL